MNKKVTKAITNIRTIGQGHNEEGFQVIGIIFTYNPFIFDIKNGEGDKEYDESYDIDRYV